MSLEKAIEAQEKSFYYDNQALIASIERQNAWADADEAFLFLRWIKYCKLMKKEKRLTKRINLYYDLSNKYHKQYFDIMWNLYELDNVFREEDFDGR